MPLMPPMPRNRPIAPRRPGGLDDLPGGGGGDARPEPRSAPGRRIIRTGELTVRVQKYEEASRRVEILAGRCGGFVGDRNVTRNPDGTTSGRLTVRVPAERFGELMAALKKLGKVEGENVRAQDVTVEYTDLQSRIRNAEAEEASLLELLKAKSRSKLEEIIALRKEISRVRGEIEKAQGRLNVLSKLASLSTIHVTLREKSRAVPSGSLSVEVRELEAAVRSLTAAVGGSGGRILNGRTSKRGDGTLTGTYSIEVRLPRFAEFVALVEKLGRVESRRITGQEPGAIHDEGAERVKCALALTLFEKSRPVPSGSLRIEVSTLAAGGEKLSHALARVEGNIVSSTTSRDPSGAGAANYQLRVRMERFEELLRGLEKIGRVDNRQVRGLEPGVTVVGGAAQVPCSLAVQLVEKRRLIPSGNVGIEVPDVKEATAALGRALSGVGGDITASAFSKTAGGAAQGSFGVRVATGRFGELLDALEQLGRVDSRRIQNYDPALPADSATGQVPCSFQLILFERSVPVPDAKFGVEVGKARAAARRLDDAVASLDAKVEKKRDLRRPDGTYVIDYKIMVKVARFAELIAKVEGLGKVRALEVDSSQLVAATQADPDALASVVVRLYERPALVSGKGESIVRGMITKAFNVLAWSAASVAFGLIVVLPPLALVAVVYYARRRRRAASSKKS